MNSKIKIPFNIPTQTGHEERLVIDALKFHTMSGNGKYTKLCEAWFEQHLKCAKALLVTSCTHALEMAALLLNISDGDEVIVPSYTFVSTANAFALRGAKIVFIDIDPQTMNMNADNLASLITPKTKCIVPVHYAGVSCDMNRIMDIANSHNIKVVEDAAQCIGSESDNNPIGCRGHLSTFSFHETKNLTSAGEGGMLVINDKELAMRAEIIREKGTNRTQFFRGEVDKYSWVDLGSSYLLGELNAAYLYSQLSELKAITAKRLSLWKMYYIELKGVRGIEIPIQNNLKHNAHIFYIKVQDLKTRQSLLKYLRNLGIESVFHYVPLHSSPMGKKIGNSPLSMENTDRESDRLLRLPLHYQLTKDQCRLVCGAIKSFSH